MIPPKPFIATCPKCGKVKFIAPKSDALSSLDEIALHCEKCGVSMRKGFVGALVSLFSLFSTKDTNLKK